MSGETVTEETALHYSAVWNAVTLYSGTVGSLPLHLMQKKDKEKRTAENKPVYKVMHSQWNPFMTAMIGRETMMAHILTWGNGYAEKIFNGVGEVVQLWPIPPNRVKRIAIVNDDLMYEITVGNETKWISRKKILHVPGLGFDGFIGYSVIAMARKSLGLAMAMETFGSHYFGQGTHPGVIVSHPDQLDPQTHANLKKSLTDIYSGLGQTHRLMLLEDGMKIEKIGIPPEDSQFLQSRQFQIPEVARWFNLPPHKLKDLTKSSFSNIESEQISYVRDSLLPWLIRLEQSYDMQLLSESDKNLSGYGRLYFKHNVDGLLRGDMKARSAYYKEMFGIGAYSINKILELEDENPVDHPGADKHYIPTNNMTAIEDQGNPPLQLPKPEKTAPAFPSVDPDRDAALAKLESIK